LISALHGHYNGYGLPVYDKKGYVGRRTFITREVQDDMRLMRRLITYVVTLLCAVTLTNTVRAEELPLWEAGIGVTGLSIPDYRGSNQQRFYALPFPYLIYRGDILKVDKEGIYGNLFKSDRVRLSLSAGGGVPVKSSNNTARTGMPDLNPTAEIGPSLDVCINGNCDADFVMRFRLPIRGVIAIATDLSQVQGIGFIISPQFNIDWYNIWPGKGWDIGLVVGPLFTSEEYNEYYYAVPQQFAVPGFRSAYRASGGYSGSEFLMSVSKRFDYIWFGAFASYDNLSGAAFDNSPLMRTRQAFTAGFGIAWVFAKSKTKVQTSQ